MRALARRRWCWRAALAAGGAATAPPRRRRRGLAGGRPTAPASTCPGCAAKAPASAPTPRRSKPRWPPAWAAIRSRARRRSSSRRSSRSSRTAFRSRSRCAARDGKLLGNRVAHQQPGRLPLDRDRGGADDRDPDRSRRAGARARAQAAAPAPPPAPPPAPRRGLSGRAGDRVRRRAAGGCCRGSPRAAGLAATVDVGGVAADRRRRRVLPRAPHGGARRRLRLRPDLRRAGRLLRPARRRRQRLRWELCAGGNVGVLHAVVFSGTARRPGAALDVRGRRADAGHHPIYRAWWPGNRPRGHATPAPPRRFSLMASPPGWTLCSPSRWCRVAGWAGVGLRWR